MNCFRLLATVILLASASLVSAQTTRPAPQVERTLIISVDGLRPDVFLRAEAPRLRELMKNGSFTLWARSTPHSVTLPTHVSMLTGVEPGGHGILWNSDLPLAEPVYPRVPTIFELAKQANRSTAAVAGKSKFKVLNKPGAIDHSYWPDETRSNDGDVAEQALELLRSHRPEVAFVHFAGVDVAGHRAGWGSEEQLQAVALADRCVGQLVDALAEMELLERTLLIVTADHGGSGRTHGAEDAPSRYVPWIVTGPGIRRNYDLTMNRTLTVEIYDTFTTACTLLDIPVGRKVNGKFVEDVLEQRELLRADVPAGG